MKVYLPLYLTPDERINLTAWLKSLPLDEEIEISNTLASPETPFILVSSEQGIEGIEKSLMSIRVFGIHCDKPNDLLQAIMDYSKKKD